MLRCSLTLRKLIVIVTIFFFPHLVMAGSNVKDLPGNIHLGSIRLHPQFSVKGLFSDNYFLTANNQKDEWLTIFIPGLTLQVPFRKHTLTLDYRAEIERHSEYSHFDGTFHNASGLLELKFARGLGLNIGYEYKKSRTPPDFEDDTVDDYHYYNGIVEALYQFTNRYKVTTAYRHVIKDFQDHENREDNFSMNEGTITLHYRFLPKTHLLLEYAFSRIDNKDIGDVDTDNDNHHIWMGLEWDPSKKINGRIAGGYTTRKYHHEQGGEDEDTFSMGGNLTYFFSRFITASLKLERQIIQTERTSDQSFYGIHYIRTGGNLSLNYKIPFLTNGFRNSSTTIKGLYYNDDYSRGRTRIRKRDDDRYGGSVQLSLKYWDDRLDLTLNYRYLENSSNISLEDYEENRFFVQFSILL